MAWTYTPNESGWAGGHVVTLADFQNIENDLHTWGGDVNAGANKLTNCAGITSSGAATIDLGAPLNQRAVSLYADGSTAWDQQLNNNLSGFAGVPFVSNVFYGTGLFAWRLKSYSDRTNMAVPGTLLMTLSSSTGLLAIPAVASTTYANNAAAVSAGLAVGTLYRITGTDTPGIVH